MLRCYITHRHQAGGAEPLLRLVQRALEIGVELIQIREKDWTSRELAEFTRQALALPNPQRSFILVNGRPDVALACGAHGVHLPEGQIQPFRLRAITPPRFIVGVSCHSRDEMFQAMEEDADYVFISPVFAPLSKQDTRPVLGLEGLREAVRGLPIPSFALGGITPSSMAACMEAGVPGIAGISLFQQELLRS